MPEQYYNIRVCSDHFISGTPSKLYDVTNPDWAPSLKLVYEEVCEDGPSSRSERYDRAVKRRRLCLQENEAEIVQDEAEIAQDEAVEMEATEAEPTVEDLIKENETLKVLQQNYLGEIEDLRRENDLLKQSEQSCQDKIEELKKENERLICFDDQLKVKLEAHTLNEENFRNDDKKVLFYTGLSTWELLLTLFTYVQPNLSCTAKSSLSPFQQLLLTLMRLRLNMSNQDLGYRYQIHQSTASRVFSRVLEVLFVKLKPFIKWPDRDALLKTMPMAFRKHFPRCSVIIDCFEIFLDRPTHLLARAQTYSSYKHHNTVKYLIGITPQGTVSFISEGWGGRNGLPT